MFLHPVLSVFSAYLARLSPPTTSTFTLVHRLATAAFSSVVKCTMVSGSLLVILMGQKQVCAAASLHGLLFLICCPRPFLPPIKRDYWSKVGGHCQGWDLGKGGSARWTFVSLILLVALSGILCCRPPYPPLCNSYLKVPATLPEVTSRLTMKHS